jgi:hypothetical protein
MLDLALDVGDAPAGVALVPGAVELLSGRAKLHNEVRGQVLRLGLATLLAPELDQCRFAIAHDDPGVRTAEEHSSVRTGFPQVRLHKISISERGVCCRKTTSSGS